MKKRKKITNTMQEVAVDILEELEVLLMQTKERTVDCNYIVAILSKKSKEYALCEDPFTKMLCTSKDYAKSSEVYEHQLLEEKYDF